MNDQILQIIIQARDTASAVMKKVGVSIDAVNKQAGNLANAGLKSMQGGFETTANVLKTGFLVGMTGVVGMLGLVGTQAIKGAGDFEVYRSTLTTMLGSQELANKRLQEYADIGKSTPFELPQVVQLGNSLQALGKYSRENVIMLGDLASASGKPIEQVSGAFAKLASGQKGVAVDMFRDLLITTEDWTKATGKGISKSGELMATTEEMLAVLPKIMKDKKYSGMMAEQSKTLYGIWSNLMDSIGEKTRTIGEKLLPYIKPAVQNLIDFINGINLDGIIEGIVAIKRMIVDGDFTGKFGELFGIMEDDAIVDNIMNIRGAFLDLYDILTTGDIISGDGIIAVFGGELGQKIIDFVVEIRNNTTLWQSVLVGLGGTIAVFVGGALASMIIAVASAVAPFVAVAVAIGGLFYLFQTNQDVQNFVNGAWKLLVDGFVYFKDNVLPQLVKLWDDLYNVFQTQILPVLTTLWDTFITQIVPSLVSLWDELVKLQKSLWDLWNTLSPYLIPIFKFLAIVIGVVVVGAIIAIGGFIIGFINILTWLFGKIREGIDWFNGFVRSIQDFGRKADEAFRNLKNINLGEVGKNIVQGLINGLNDKIGELKRKATDIANSVQNSIKDALKIKSPSRVMMELGEYTAEGLALGMDKKEDMILKASDRMAESSMFGVRKSISQSTNTTTNNNDNRVVKTINQYITNNYPTGNGFTPPYALNF